MTLVLALESEGSVHLATDSFLGNAGEKDLIDQPKWFTLHGVTFGYAGDLSVIQLVRYGLKFRSRRSRESIDQYLSRYALAIRTRLLETDIKDHASFIAAIEDRVYTIQEDWSVIRSYHRYAAIGIGAPYALGSLASTPGLPPKDRLDLALHAASRHSAGVSPPFYFRTL